MTHASLIITADRQADWGTASAHDAPVRLICRHVSRLLLARGQRWKPLMPAERLAGLVMETVLSAGIAHLPYRSTAEGSEWNGIVSVTERARPVSVLAITQSLDLPYASIARRVDELVAAGFLLKGRRGISIAPGFFADGRVARIVVDDRADLAQMLDLLAAAGHDFAPELRNGGLGRLPDEIVERALLAFSLRGLESVTELYGDVVSGMLAVTVIAANVEHLIEHASLGDQFTDQDTPPPDELRKAITVRELARQTGMPFETVRRRVNELRAHDILEHRDDGVILPARVLLRPRHMADNVRIVGHFHWLLATLSDLAWPSR